MNAPKRQAPARLPLLLGLCMLLGFAGTCSGFVEVAGWREPVEFQVPALPTREEADPGWERLGEAWPALGEVQTKSFQQKRPAASALAGVNWIASSVLFVGAWLARNRMPRGRSLLQAGLVLSQAYALLGMAVGTWIRLGMFEAARDLLHPFTAEPGLTGTTAWLALGGFAGGIVLAVVGMLVQLFFYLWMQRLLRRPEVAAQLDPG